MAAFKQTRRGVRTLFTSSQLPTDRQNSQAELQQGSHACRPLRPSPGSMSDDHLPCQVQWSNMTPPFLTTEPDDDEFLLEVNHPDDMAAALHHPLSQSDCAALPLPVLVTLS